MGKLNSITAKLKKVREKRREEKPYIISEESAMEQIIMILDYYEIAIEPLEEDARAEKAGNTLIDQLVKYFRRGQLQAEITEKGLIITQETCSGATIKYGEINARTKKVMGKFAQDDNHNKLYAFLGTLCGEGQDVIEKLKAGGGQNDLMCAEVLGTLFLLV